MWGRSEDLPHWAESWLVDFDPTDQGLIDDRGERNHILTARIRRLRELLDVGDVLPTRGREDVEIRQHLRPVDAHVELPRTPRGVERFAQVQPHVLRFPSPQPANPR